jgi:hypothetical protein
MWQLPHLHVIAFTYRAAGLANVTQRIAAWIGHFAPQLTAVTIRRNRRTSARRFRTAAVVRNAAPLALRSHSDCFTADGSGSLDVLMRLARCPRLEHLTLEPLITSDAVLHLPRAKPTTPFLRLRSFDGRIKWEAIYDLREMCSTTTRLQLQVVHGSSATLFFRSVAAMTHLRSLTLSGEIRSSVNELLRLRRLSLLVELDLTDVVLYTDDFPRPLDDDVDTLVSGLPLLRILKLGFGSQLSDGAYILVAQHCRHLTEFAFVADCSIRRLEGSDTASPPFPELQFLSARDITGAFSTM